MDYEKELLETVRKLPNQPPKETVDVLRSRGLLQKEVLVYKAGWAEGLNEKKEKVAKVYCTHCGAEMNLEYVPIEEICTTRFFSWMPTFGFINPRYKEAICHGQQTPCPECGHGANVIHISSFGADYQTICSDEAVSVHEVNGHLCILSWNIWKNTDKDGTVWYSNHRSEGVIYIGKKHYRVTGETRVGINSLIYHEWEARKKYRELLGVVNKKRVIPFHRRTIYSTDNPNCALYEFIDQCESCRPSMYMKLWQKLPQLENVVKQGFGRILNSAIESCTDGNYYKRDEYVRLDHMGEIFDLKKVKPSDILRITKQEIPVAKKCDLNTLQLYRSIKEIHGFRLEIEYINKSREIGAYDLRILFEKYRDAPVVRTINYLYKKKSSKVNGRYLIDYWEMLLNVYENIPQELRYPKDLEKAHDEILKLQKEKVERELSEKICERGKAFEGYTYISKDLGLMIRPVRNQKELIDEGKILSHCVARYAEEVASGRTMIFFIRHTREPDTPYFTLELKNGVVQQNRGEHNCGRTEEVKKFEEEWLEYIQKGKRGINNGKYVDSNCAAS